MGDTPSALRRFTTEFGMGSGGTTALLPLGKFFLNADYMKVADRFELGTSPTYQGCALPTEGHISNMVRSVSTDTTLNLMSGSSLLSHGRPHTTIGATAFHC